MIIKYFLASLLIAYSGLVSGADKVFRCHELAIVTESQHSLTVDGEARYCRSGVDVFKYIPDQRGWGKIPMYIESDDVFEKIDFRCQKLIGGGKNLYCLNSTVVWSYSPATERWQKMFMRKINF